MPKRNKGTGERRLRQGMFQNTPWRSSEIDELFAANKTFRTLSLTAARHVARAGRLPPPDKADAKELAQQMGSISDQIGRKLTAQVRVAGGKIETLNRYPHPSLLLLALLKLGGRGNILADAGVGRAGPFRSINEELIEALAGLLTTYRGQGNLARGWIELTRAAGITEQPFFLRHKLHDVRPSSGDVNGFRLSKIWLRVPYQNVLKTDTKGNVIVQPGGYTLLEVNLLDAAAVEQFGEVWMGVSGDGRGLYLASKKGASASITDVLKLGKKAGSQGARPFYPPKDVKARLSPVIAERLKQGAKRLRGKVPSRLTERVDAIA